MLNERLDPAEAELPTAPPKPREDDNHGRAVDEIGAPDHPAEAENGDRGERNGDSLVMITITELLGRAKRAIETGENSLHDAAEDIAAAQEQGATQRQIAEAVGKSAAWVNRLLKWRQSGYQDDTAFGPQARASRQRAKRVQATEQTKKKPATTSEQAQAAAARARAETAKAEAARARADAQKAKAEANKAKADARTARAKAKARAYSFFRGAFVRGSGNWKLIFKINDFEDFFNDR
jgi:hypothetical protein